MTNQAGFVVHVTTQGERWDLLAYRYYGIATLYAPIIRANPKVVIEPVFEAGITIDVPILPESTVVSADLPPWRSKTASA
ncbi:tail protein X [Candidatus Binatus sp.]|uniref:tail protein X n=1 Tax=Candidatus Binatus sp. TaxID=2811406 RepID=UPI00351D1B4A